MFLVALAVALAHRSLNMEATLALFLVAFSLALVGALVLFHLLSSTAQINRTSYKLGGAAAGFVILLVLFYKLLGVPFANENKLYRLATDEDTDRYIQIADDKTRVKRLKSPWLNKIAEDTLYSTQSTFNALSIGKFVIRADETPLYLTPLVEGVKRSYHATSLVSPDTFWNQPWAKAYSKANYDAVQRRKVDVTRIFILRHGLTPAKVQGLTTLMQEQAKNGITVRVLAEDQYRGNREDLQDFLLADDQVVGQLTIDNPQDIYATIDFSVDAKAIREYTQRWQNLLDSSMTLSDWGRGQAGNSPSTTP